MMSFKKLNKQVNYSMHGQSILKLASVRYFNFCTKQPQKVTFKFEYLSNGKEHEVVADVGLNLVKVAHQNKIDIEGACDCSLTCSTCHIILEKNIYDKQSKPTETEEDLLDLAYGLTQTSRLGCQIKVDPSFEGCKIKIPANSNI